MLMWDGLIHDSSGRFEELEKRGWAITTGWINCWNGCDDGWFDDYEEDPIECEPGEISRCSECKGEGGWRVCGECNTDNPEVEW
jgi:hypothetical protein